MAGVQLEHGQSLATQLKGKGKGSSVQLRAREKDKQEAACSGVLETSNWAAENDD